MKTNSMIEDFKALAAAHALKTLDNPEGVTVRGVTDIQIRPLLSIEPITAHPATSLETPASRVTLTYANRQIEFVVPVREWFGFQVDPRFKEVARIARAQQPR